MTPNQQELHVSVKDMWIDDDGVACIDAAALPQSLLDSQDITGYDVWIVDLVDPKDPIALACRKGRIAVANRH